MQNLRIYNEDCITGAREHILDGSIDLLICDPPFGIGESDFSKHYNRNRGKVIPGYAEAPADYGSWTRQWMTEASRILSSSGSAYFVSGHTNLRHLLNAVDSLGLCLINHLVWKYNFGVSTRCKFVTSHYHILYLKKLSKARVTFNVSCRFGDRDRNSSGRSLQYQDLEDVWVIPREYQRGGLKNSNKLPTALVEKMIRYSSNPGDVVGDLFLGNFTTATVAQSLGRIPVGFEINEAAYAHHFPKLLAAAASEKVATSSKPLAADRANAAAA